MISSSRGAMSLVTVFLLALLLLVSTQELRKTYIFSDLFFEWKNSLQQSYASEWLLDFGIESVKDNFDYLFELEATQALIEVPLVLPASALVKSMLKRVDRYLLVIKRIKEQQRAKDPILLINLCFITGQHVDAIASCLLIKVNAHEESKQPYFMVNYYTIGAIV